jgi:hypothetical protein
VTTVYESMGFPAPRGARVTLRLLLSTQGDRTEIRIEREERLPHKSLVSTVLTITQPTTGIEPLARAMTTFAHELERLHARGYSLRERAGGGWRGAWRADLLTPDGGHAAMSWEIEHKRPHRTLEPLARALASLDRPRPQMDEPADQVDSLAAFMRAHGGELRRNHAVDALIAADPAVPTDELLEELDARGLLSPTDTDAGL